MPEARHNALVTNTTPLIALAAATDSLDILRYPISIPDAINRMRERGIWLGEQVVRFALEQSKQTES